MLRSRSLLCLAGLLTALTTGGCGSCAGKAKPDAGPAPAPRPITSADLPPPPSSWTFRPLLGALEFALPEHCAMRAPPVRAAVASPPVSFVVEPRTPGALIVGEASGYPPRLTAAGVITLDPAGTSRDPVQLPWLDVASMPRVAHFRGGGWVAAVDRPPLDGPARVSLWRGATSEDLGEGEAFEGLDLACGDERCALLTSRRAPGPGAELWIGKPSEPAAAWRVVPLGPTRQGALSNAHGAGIARVDARGPAAGDAGAALLSPRIVVAMDELAEVVFLGVDDGPGVAKELARLPAPHGIIDAVALPRPMALVYAVELDEEGCSHEGGKMNLVRDGLPSIPFRAAAPPLVGSLRRLEKGFLASWIAPLGCSLQRRVVYAVVLDDDGAPTSDVMAIGDAATYGVATAGSDVDLWIQDARSVIWLRARCAAP